jgi:hypothetical protein
MHGRRVKLAWISTHSAQGVRVHPRDVIVGVEPNQCYGPNGPNALDSSVCPDYDLPG